MDLQAKYPDSNTGHLELVIDAVGVIHEVSSDGTLKVVQKIHEVSSDDTLKLIQLPEVGDTILDHIHPEDQDAFQHNLHWVAGHVDRSVTIQLQFYRGREWWIAVNVRISYVDSALTRLEVEFDEAASFKKMENQFHQVVELSQHGVVVLENSGPVFINNGFAKLVGYEGAEELIESGHADLISNIYPDDLGMIADRIAARVRGEEVPDQYEFRLMHQNGDIIWVETLSSRIVWNGQPASLSWLTDVTSRKRAEHENLEYIHQLHAAKVAAETAGQDAEEARKGAERANKAKSVFLTSMSHELRTPMNAILGFAQVLQVDRNNPLSAVQNERIDYILAGGKHLLELINEILDLARIEADRISISLEEVDTNDLVLDCVALVIPLGRARGVKIIDRLDTIPPTLLYTDRLRVKQILLNLLSNAVKFNQDNGTVIVDGGDTGDGLFRLSVTDTGIGIAESDHASVFEMFHQLGVDPMLTRDGSGIGLVTTKLLVERMGGRIGFESEEGVGSTFWVELPQASKELPLASGDDNGRLLN